MTPSKDDETKDIENASRSTTDLVILIAAIGVVIVNVITAFHTGGKINDVKQRAIVNDMETDKKLDVIHEQTNSNLTGVNNRLEEAYTKIENLERLLLEEKETNEPK